MDRRDRKAAAAKRMAAWKPIPNTRKYKSPTEMDSAVDAYVERCRADKEPLTMTGLALGLGFCDRESMLNYKSYDDGRWVPTIKRALALVEQAYEKRLHGTAAAGAIFALKNMGWTDAVEHRHSGSIDLVAAIAEGRRRAIEMSAPRVIEHDAGDD